jgi:hypothetical protein
MLAKTASGTFIGNYRIITIFKPHSLPFNGAAFIAASAQQMLRPGKAFFAIELGKAHTHIIDIHIM